MRNCPVCSKIVNAGCIYCSRSCSNVSRGHRSDETKQKLRLAALSNPTGWAKDKSHSKSQLGVVRAKRETRICPTCNVPFVTRLSDNRKFCSSICVKRGGVRTGSGKAKTGWYKGVYCGSTYELAFLIWNLDHNINIVRCTESFDYEYNGKIHKYYPDFIINDKIYEIKGRVQPVDFVKIKVADAVMIDKDAMRSYIDYVVQKYNINKNKLYTLYESK